MNTARQKGSPASGKGVPGCARGTKEPEIILTVPGPPAFAALYIPKLMGPH